MSQRTKGAQSVEQGRSAVAKKWTIGLIMAGVVVIGIALAGANRVFSSGTVDSEALATTVADAASTPVESPVASVAEALGGMAALEQASADNKYLFAFFWKTDDAQTRSMRKVFDQATAQVEDRAQAVAVCITDAAERGIVDKFELSRAPMPLVLAIAPNGAITGGFPRDFSEGDLLQAFGTPALEQSMKALQDGKLVLLCVQSEATTSNAAALEGVRAFQADPRYAAAAEVVMLDPRDPAEAAFLGDLKIDPLIKQAVTAFLAPPGSVVAEFEGPTSKEQFLTALQNANACGPGGACGPSGCGPR